MTRWFALGLLLLGCSADELTAHRTDEIKGGVLEPTRTEVVALMIDPPVGSVGFCTAFLISPAVVMTARHCVSELVGTGLKCADETVGGVTRVANRPLAPVPPTRFRVFQEADLSQSSPASGRAIRRVVVPTGSEADPVCGHDVALLVLDAPVANARHLSLRAAAAAVGEQVSVSGYGYDGAVAASDGVRRTRAGVVVTTTGEVRGADGFLRTTASDWVADVGPCGGDSGSPAFDAVDAVTGVMSRGSPTVCEQMVYTQVAPYFEWAAAVVREEAQRSGVSPPAWAGVDAGVPDAGAPEVTLAAVPQALGGPAEGCSATPGGAPWLLLAALWLAAKKKGGQAAF